jgi:hypothetical protein
VKSQAEMGEHMLDLPDPLGVSHREAEALGEVAS